MAVAIDRYILIIFPTKRPIQRAQAVPMIVGIWALAAGVCLPMVAHYKYYSGPERAAETLAAALAAMAAASAHSEENSTYQSTVVTSSETSSSSSSGSGELLTTVPIEDTIIVFCGYFCEEAWPSERVQKIYGTFVLVLQFLVPLSVIAFCYSHIWIRLARSAKMKKAMNASKKNGRSGSNTTTESTNLRSVAAGQQQQQLNRQASTNPSSAEARQQAVLRRKRRTNRMLIAMVSLA